MATIYDVAPEPDDIEEPIASPSILDKPPAAVLATTMPQPENPMQAYALAFDAPRDKPLIAIVIDDMGLDRVRSQRALEMAGPLTLSFLTYATNLSTGRCVRARQAMKCWLTCPWSPLIRKKTQAPGL